MSEEVEELKRQLEILEIEREREDGLLKCENSAAMCERVLELGNVTAALGAVRKEAAETVQKMLDLEADQTCERQNRNYCTNHMYISCVDELTAEVERLKRENLNLEEALKASQNN